MVILRSILFNIAFFTFTAIVAVATLPLLAAPRHWHRAAMRGWAVGVTWLLRAVCGVRLRVEGMEHLPPSGPALLASRHESAFDTMVWFTLVPDVLYVQKVELFRVPLYGWHARKAGMIGVDRTGGANAMRGMLREAQTAANSGRQIVIFPEGTRVPHGQTVPFQPGVVALANATGLPVTPVATNSGRVWGRRAFTKRPGEIVIRILPPLPARMPRGALMPALEAAITEAQARL